MSGNRLSALIQGGGDFRIRDDTEARQSAAESDTVISTMSIFTKPLSELRSADLQELISDGAVENIRLEFKSEVPNKDETLKKLSSFANTFGGFMVVGAKANSADGRIQDLNGVDEEPGYKQKLVQWSFEAVVPPLSIEVSDPIPAPSGNGRVCYVVYTPESDTAPHFLNGRKGIWVRTDEFSARFEARLADERELQQLLDRRNLIRARRASLAERARKRFEIFAGAKLVGPQQFPAFFTFCIIPRFPARQLCEQDKLRSFTEPSEANWVSWRQVIFPDPGAHSMSQHESQIILNAARGLSFFEVNVWGLLFYGVRVDENDSGEHGIHLFRFIGYILLFVRHAGRLLRRMGYSGPLHIESSLGPIWGIKWLLPDVSGAWLNPLPGSELDNAVAFSLSRTSEELAERPDNVAMEILKVILYAVNLYGLTDSRQEVERLLRAGYHFNFWGDPPLPSA